MSLPPSACVTAFGRRGSGKTLWLWRQWFPRVPRLLIQDRTGEWRAKEPHAIFVSGYEATVGALQAVAQVREWRVVSYCSQEEVIRLSALLTPLGQQDRSYPVLVGGMGWCLDEVQTYAHSRRPSAMTETWLVGRHSGLTMLAASQRPSNVSKDVLSQSDVVAIFAIHDPNGVAYFAEDMGKDKAQEAIAWANSGIKGSPTHGRHALYFPSSGTIELKEPVPLE